MKLLALLILAMSLLGCSVPAEETEATESIQHMAEMPAYISDEYVPDTTESPQPLEEQEEDLVSTDGEGLIYLESGEVGIHVTPLLNSFREAGLETEGLTEVHLEATLGEVVEVMAIRDLEQETPTFHIFVLTDQEMVKWTSITMNETLPVTLERLPIYGVLHLSREFDETKDAEVVYGTDSTGRRTDLVTLSDLSDLYARSWIHESDEGNMHLSMDSFDGFSLITRGGEDYRVTRGYYLFGSEEDRYRAEPDYLELVLREDGVSISGLYHVVMEENHLELFHLEGYPVLGADSLVFEPAYNRQANLADLLLYEEPALRENLEGSYRAQVVEESFQEGEYVYEILYGEGALDNLQDATELRMTSSGKLYRKEGESWVQVTTKQ